MPRHEGTELSVRQNHGGKSISEDGMNPADRYSSADYYDIWGQAAPPAMQDPPQGTIILSACMLPSPNNAQDLW